MRAVIVFVCLAFASSLLAATPADAKRNGGWKKKSETVFGIPATRMTHTSSKQQKFFTNLAYRAGGA
jgi:hypothetical protein